MKFTTKLVLPVLALSLIGSSALANKNHKEDWLDKHPYIENALLITTIIGIPLLFAEMHTYAMVKADAALKEVANTTANNAISKTTQEILLGSGV